jgi:restriction system protein
MARNHRSSFEDFIDLVSRLPWWAGVLIAFISYLVLHYVAQLPPATASTLEGAAHIAWRQFLIAFANIFQYLIPIAALFGSALSAYYRYKAKNLHQQLAKSPSRNTLNQMNWREFELLAGEAFRQMGYQVNLRGGDNPDGGIDLVLYREGKKYLVQCKHWKTQRVGVKPLREFFGVMAAEGADGGFFVASGHFTEEAKRFAKKTAIELVDTEQLLSLVKHTPPTNQMDNDHLTHTEAVPSCPICQEPMVLRTASRGKQAGKQFWGCSRFPHCRGTRPLTEHSTA